MEYSLTEYRQNLSNIFMRPQQTLSNTYINDNINDFEAITPNHILIVYQNDENWFANLTLYIKGQENHFKLCSPAQILFWNYWRYHYLPTLTSRANGQNSKINLSKRDLLIIKSKHVSRSHWPLGRILDILYVQVAKE